MADSEHARGRSAQRPRQIPRTGWRDILLRTKREIGADNLSLIAAGVAFYTLLAIFPALASTVSLYGLFADPGEIENHYQSLAVLMPADARPLLLDQIRALTVSSDTALGATVIGGFLLALLSAMKGTKAVVMALNIAYNESEKRGFVRLNLIAFVLTLASVVFIVVMLALVVALPAAINLLALQPGVAALLSLLRWPILLIMVLLALACVYHFAPSRRAARWHWVSWGAALATAVWLFASIGFSVYVENFGNYNKVYGSLGALVILLMWLYLSAYALLLGAELNAEMEHQTCVDTTVGKARPFGKRDAYVADTLGEVP